MRQTLQSTGTDEIEVPTGRSMDLLLRARRETAQRLAPERFSETVSSFETELGQWDAQQFWGASAAGLVLTGALLDRASGDFRLWTPESPGPVVLLDGVIADVFGLTTTAVRMRKSGVHVISAIVIRVLADRRDQIDGLDGLVEVGDPRPLRSLAHPKAA